MKSESFHSCKVPNQTPIVMVMVMQNCSSTYYLAQDSHYMQSASSLLSSELHASRLFWYIAQ